MRGDGRSLLECPEHDSKACEWAPDRGIERLGSIARAHHDWDWLDWRRDAWERRVVVRAHLEESASGLRAGCSLRTMKASICVIGTLGGIKVSLHWGGLFGVRESEASSFPGAPLVEVKITTLGA